MTLGAPSETLFLSLQRRPPSAMPCCSEVSISLCGAYDSLEWGTAPDTLPRASPAQRPDGLYLYISLHQVPGEPIC